MSILFVILTFLFPPLGLILGLYGVSKDFRHWRAYIFCLALFMSIIAYCYYPAQETDLKVYFENMDFFGNLSFSQALFYNGSGTGIYSNLYALKIFYWIIGKIGDYHLAPAITVYFVYYIGYYMVCKVGEVYMVSKRYVVYYIVFITFTLNLCWIANNIRNVFAFSVVIFAIFRDCFLKKRNFITIVLYIFPILFHSSAIVLVLLRMVLALHNTKWKVILILAVIEIKPVINGLTNLFNSIGSGNFLIAQIRDALNKAYIFFYDTNSEWGIIASKSLSIRLSKLFYVLLAVIFCIIAFRLSSKINKGEIREIVKEDGVHKLVNLSFCMGLLTISCVPMLMPEYWRFASAMIIASGVVYIMASETFQEFSKLSMNFIFLITPLCAFLTIRELFICDVTKLLLKPFISSPIVILCLDIFKFL